MRDFNFTKLVLYLCVYKYRLKKKKVKKNMILDASVTLPPKPREMQSPPEEVTKHLEVFSHFWVQPVSLKQNLSFAPKQEWYLTVKENILEKEA